MPDHGCVRPRPLKRPLEEEEEEEEEEPSPGKVRTVTPSSSSSSSPSFSDNVCQVQDAARQSSSSSSSAFKPSSSFSPLPHCTSRFLGLHPDPLPSSPQERVDPLGQRLSQSHPPPRQDHHCNHQSAALLSPLVPPFTIHSFMMQRQLLAQAAAMPAHMYGHQPMAAGFGDVLHQGLYHMSALHPQPAFSPAQLSAGLPSTKLS